jgi:hypothetical protein
VIENGLDSASKAADTDRTDQTVQNDSERFSGRYIVVEEVVVAMVAVKVEVAVRVKVLGDDCRNISCGALQGRDVRERERESSSFTNKRKRCSTNRK